jgi:N-carbamoylputrescine amidase
MYRGKIIAEAGQNDETILYADIDMKEVDDVRRSFPYLAQRRTDLYDTIQK